MKKSNNKGFSLVELIVVIAIMAVLIGVLAPQFMKYVYNSKISTDITNVDNAVQAINTALVGDENYTIAASANIDSALYSSLNITGNVPTPKTAGIGNVFVITSVNTDGTVGEVKAGGYQLYPTPNNGSVSGINAKRADGGLKK